MNSPRNCSLVPSVYVFAVSMKLPPCSQKAWSMAKLSSLSAPKPQSSPKVIVPRQSSEILRPLLPRVLYRTVVLQCLIGFYLGVVIEAFSHRLAGNKHGLAEFLTGEPFDYPGGQVLCGQ